MPIRHRKLLQMSLLALTLVLPVKRSEAIIPAVAGWLLSIGGNAVLITDVVAGMTGLISGVLWYDCNKFSTSPVCTNKPASMDKSAAPAEGITVSLAPDAKRSNPDPSKFDDSREAKPKSSIPATASGGGSPAPDGADTFFWGSTYNGKLVTGGSAAEVARSIAFYADCGSFSGCTFSGLTRIDYPVTVQTTSPTANGSACSTQHSYSAGHYWTNGSNTWPRPANVNGAPCQPSNVTGTPAYVAQPPTTYTCPNGYTLSGQICNLTDPSQVTKPATTPCEILYYADTKTFKADPQNPNCADLQNGGKVTVPNSTDDPGSLSVQPNAANGFDITRSDGHGKTITASTGPYDAVGKGYPIVSTSSTVPAGTPDGTGSGCGIPGKPACNVALSVDAEMTATSGTAKSGITAANNSLKGLLDGIDPDKFHWSFIPNIPSAACSNPEVVIPIAGGTLTVEICSYFNKFSFFLNAVLAVLCLYGCARQIESASKA